MSTGKDRVSVITVCRDAQTKIKQTILSVVSQTYSNIEYIVIDGQSADGTANILEEFSDKIDIYVSERDNGIFDAMNKGIGMAKGDWLCFMNAGDMFAHENVIKDVFANGADYDKAMVVYGDFMMSGCHKTIKASDMAMIKHRMPFCHQSSFIKNQGFRFRTDLQIASDYALFYDIYKTYGPSAFIYTGNCVSIYDMNGVSIHNLKQLYKEYYRLFIEHKQYIYGYYYWIMSFLRNLKHRL